MLSGLLVRREDETFFVLSGTCVLSSLNRIVDLKKDDTEGTDSEIQNGFSQD